MTNTYEDDDSMLNRIMRDVMPKNVRISPNFPRYTPPDNSPEAKAARVVEFRAASEVKPVSAAPLMWFSVSTPAVFREYALPEFDAMTTEQRRQYSELIRLAEIHNAAIHCSSYRLG